MPQNVQDRTLQRTTAANHSPSPVPFGHEKSNSAQLQSRRTKEQVSGAFYSMQWLNLTNNMNSGGGIGTSIKQMGKVDAISKRVGARCNFQCKVRREMAVS